MHKSNFFGPFPSAPEELKEIPSYVKWKNKIHQKMKLLL